LLCGSVNVFVVAPQFGQIPLSSLNCLDFLDLKKRRIENIEKVLDNHFKKLEIETPDDISECNFIQNFETYKIVEYSKDLHQNEYNAKNILTEFEMLFKSKGNPPIGYLKATAQ